MRSALSLSSRSQRPGLTPAQAHRPLPPLLSTNETCDEPKGPLPGSQSRRQAAHDAGSFAKAKLWAGEGASASRKKVLSGQGDTSEGLNRQVPPAGFGKSHHSTSEPQCADPSNGPDESRPPGGPGGRRLRSRLGRGPAGSGRGPAAWGKSAMGQPSRPAPTVSGPATAEVGGSREWGAAQADSPVKGIAVSSVIRSLGTSHICVSGMAVFLLIPQPRAWTTSPLVPRPARRLAL